MATTLTVSRFPEADVRPDARRTVVPLRAAVPLQRGSAHASPRQERPGVPLRITRRGRLVVLAVLAAVLCVAFSLGRVSTSAAPGGSAAAHRSVVVQAGDTLWAVAQRVAPGRDPRVEVAELTRLNHLGDDATVSAGQQLLVP